MAKTSNLNVHSNSDKMPTMHSVPFRTRTLSKAPEFGRGAEANKNHAREAFDPVKLAKKISDPDFLYEFTWQFKEERWFDILKTPIAKLPADVEVDSAAAQRYVTHKGVIAGISKTHAKYVQLKKDKSFKLDKNGVMLPNGVMLLTPL